MVEDEFRMVVGQDAVEAWAALAEAQKAISHKAAAGGFHQSGGHIKQQLAEAFRHSDAYAALVLDRSDKAIAVHSKSRGSLIAETEKAILGFEDELRVRCYLPKMVPGSPAADKEVDRRFRAHAATIQNRLRAQSLGFAGQRPRKTDWLAQLRHRAWDLLKGIGPLASIIRLFAGH